MGLIEVTLLSLLSINMVVLITLILLQQGKGASLGAAFGSGSANTMFGSSGANSFLLKLTVFFAIGFFAITFSLAYLAKHKAEETFSQELIDASTQNQGDSEITLPSDSPVQGESASGDVKPVSGSGSSKDDELLPLDDI